MEIISVIIGVLLGAWINNRINWKIDDRIKNLDYMTDAVFKMQFYIIKSIDEQKNYKDTYVNAMATFVKTSNILLNEVELKELSCKTLVSMQAYNQNKIYETHKNFEDDLSELHLCIHNTRNEISSFCYMLKQLNFFKNMCSK
jgi:hypothetical protein